MKENAENPKLQQLVKTAKALLMRHGIRRISVEEICREAKVSKMTFYKYFKNKVELAKFLIQQIFDEQMAKYNRIMKQDIPFTQKTKQMIQLKNNSTEMISQEFFRDLWKYPDPDIANLLNNLREESLKIILKDFEKAQKEGEIRSDVKPKFILYFLNHMSDMAKDENLLKLYDSPNELVMELTNFFFYGILKSR